MFIDWLPRMLQRFRPSRVWTERRKAADKHKQHELGQTERLEDRALLSFTWEAVGPNPFLSGQVEGTATTNSPVTGGIQAVLAHPTNPDILYVGTANGGIWRTDNARAQSPTWTPLTDQQESLSIGAMAFDPSDPTGNSIVAGYGRFSSFNQDGGPLSGLIRTSNGGQTWTAIDGNGLLDGKNISGVTVVGQTIVVAANSFFSTATADSGIFRSTNGGASFTRISGTAGLPDGQVFDLTQDPVTNSTLYATVSTGTTGGVYRSNDNGASWSLVSNAAINALFTSTTNNAEISVGRSNNVFVGVMQNGLLTGLFRSGDGGTTWTQLDTPTTTENGVVVGIFGTAITGVPGAIHFSIVADPLNPNIVYVGGGRQPLSNGPTQGGFPNSIGATTASGRLFRVNASLGAGTQATALTNQPSTLSNSSPHSFSRDMAFDSAGNIIEVDDGGVYRRTNPRTLGDWYSINGNLQVTEIHSIAYDSFRDTLIAGTEDNGVITQLNSSSASWQQALQGDGGNVAVDDSTLRSVGQSIYYYSTNNLGSFRRQTVSSNGSIVSTVFPGLSLAGNPLTSVDPNVQYYTPFVLNAVTPTRGVLGTDNVYESFDQFSTLNDVSGFTGFAISAMAYGGYSQGIPNPDVLYYGAGPDVFLRAAQNTTPQNLVNYPGDVPNDIVLNDKEWQEVYVIDDDAVWYSVDAGQSWIDITGNLTLLASGNLKTIEFVDLPGTDNDAVIVGSAGGVFETRLNSLGSWTELGLGLPNAVVDDLEYDTSDDILVAGTLGRGAWVMRDASITFDPPTQAATINFDNSSYRIGDDVTINLGDIDLAGTGTVTVIVTSDSGDIESVTLNEVGGTGVFRGTLATASAETSGFVGNNGIMQVDRGATITVTYSDQDNGLGQTVTVTDTAQIFELSDFFDFDFSDSTGAPFAEGFTTSGTNNQWHLSTGHGLESGHSLDDSFYFGAGEGITGGGSYSNNADGTLTSPVLNLVGVPTLPIFLEFNHLLEAEDLFDTASISVVTSSGTFLLADNNVLSNLPDSTSGAWQHVALDLSAYAGQQIRLQFRFTSNATTTREGWYIDDIAIRAPAGEIQGTKFNDTNGNGIQDFGEVGIPGWVIFTDYNGNGELDDATLNFTNSTSAPLTDAGTTTSTLNVAGVNSAIADLNVQVTLTHNRDQELTLDLISPRGTRVRLVQNSGGSGQNFIGTTFDDEAPLAVQFGIAPFLGSYIPTQSLSAFDGEDANGTWTLQIVDNSPGNTGTLLNWSLATTVHEVSAVTDNNGNYALSGLAAGTYTIAEVPQTGWEQTFPGGTGTYTVTLGTGRLISGLDFGNQFVNPTLTLSSGNALYAENDPPVTIDPRATLVDANSTTYNNGTLTVTLTQNGSFDDVLSIRNQGTGSQQVGLSGNTVTYQGVPIGFVNGGTLLQPLVVVFNANSTTAAVQAVIRAIQFEVLGDNPSGLTRTVEFVVTDDTGGTSLPATKLIEVLPINDAPIINLTQGTSNYNEGGGTVTVDSTATLVDPDSPDFNGGFLDVSLLGNENGATTTFENTFNSLDTPRSTLGGTMATTPYLVDFETGTGAGTNENYTVSGATNLWHLSNGLSAIGGHTPSNGFYFGSNESAGAAGTVFRLSEGYLLSPTIDLTAVTGPATLSFNYWLDYFINATSGQPEADVDVSVIGSLTGTTVLSDLQFANPTNPLLDTNGQFRSIQLDLTNFTGQLIQLQFHYRDRITIPPINPVTGVRPPTPVARGWFVDDVQIDGFVPQGSSTTTVVNNMQGTISDVNVKINITHNDVSQLTAYLVSPSGTRVKLFANVGISNFFSTNQNFTNTIFDDSADESILDFTATAPFTGSFRPEKELSTLIGEDPNGVWRLELFDGVAPIDYTGTVDNWSLDISTQAVSVNESLTILHQGFGPGEIGLVGNRVTYSGTVFGTYSGGVGTTPLHVDFGLHADQPAVQALIQNIAMRIDGDNPATGPRQVQFIVNDGDGDSSLPTIKNVQVVAVNDAPVLTVPGGQLNFIEGSPATILDPFATVTDIDSANFAGGVLTISLGATATANDRVTIRSQGTAAGLVNTSGSNVRIGSTVIGTYTGGTGSAPLVITFNVLATPDMVQSVLRTISFQVLGSDPTTTPRVATFTVSDGDGGLSTPQTKTISVTEINEPPVLVLPGPTPVNYLASGAPAVIDPFALVSDNDTAVFNNGRLTVQLTSGVTSRDRLIILNQGLVTTSGSNVYYAGIVVGRYVPGASGGAMTVDFNSSAAVEAVQAVIRNVAFQVLGPAPTGGTRTVTLQVTDGRGGTSPLISRSINVQINNQAPVNTVPTISYQTNEDTSVSLTGMSVADPDASLQPITVTLSVQQGTIAVATNVAGGVASGEISGNGTNRVVLTSDQEAINATLAALNGVVYTPKLDYNGTDRVTLTTNDLGNSGQGGALVDTDSVFINIKAVTDPARITTSSGTTVNNHGAEGFLDSQVQFTGGDNALTLNGASVLISVTSGRNRSDAFKIRSQGKGTDQVYVSGTSIKINNITIAKFSGGASGKPLKIVFNANASATDVQRVLRQVIFRTATQTTVPGMRQVTYQFYDDTAVLASTATKQVNVIL